MGSGFKANSWKHTPGCFIVSSGTWKDNCHWNRNPDAANTNPTTRHICKSKVKPPASKDKKPAETKTAETKAADLNAQKSDGDTAGTSAATHTAATGLSIGMVVILVAAVAL